MRAPLSALAAILLASCVSRVDSIDMSFTRSAPVADGKTTLTWASSSDATCTATGAWSGTRSGAGSETISIPPGPSTFNLSCTNGQQTEARTVSVSLPTLTFAANTTLAKNPSPIVLTWSSPGATKCTASDDWTGDVPTSGTHRTTSSADALLKFTLSCETSDASTASTVSVRSFNGGQLRATGSNTFTDGSNSDLPTEPSFATGQDASRTIGKDPDPAFIKIDINGTPLESDANYWSCFANPKTGLYYERKFDTDTPVRFRVDNIRRSTFSYGWFNGAPDGNDGGDPGTEFNNDDRGFVPNEENGYCSNLCCYNDESDTGLCNTQDFSSAVNSYRLCGRVTWRLPTVPEIRDAINYGVIPPTLGDIRVFTSQTAASNSGSTFCYHAQTQTLSLCNKSIARQALLVSDGAPLEGQ